MSMFPYRIRISQVTQIMEQFKQILLSVDCSTLELLGFKATKSVATKSYFRSEIKIKRRRLTSFNCILDENLMSANINRTYFN